jgi:hypothetical protein
MENLQETAKKIAFLKEQYQKCVDIELNTKKMDQIASTSSLGKCLH